jgi:hypothetical protein
MRPLCGMAGLLHAAGLGSLALILVRQAADPRGPGGYGRPVRPGAEATPAQRPT